MIFNRVIVLLLVSSFILYRLAVVFQYYFKAVSVTDLQL